MINDSVYLTTNAMYHMRLFIKLLLIVITLDDALCSIDGTFLPRRPNGTKPGEDLCNPLYWYPKNIPEYCYYKKEITQIPPYIDKRPMPMPIPIPLPPLPPIMPPILPYPLPFGIPLAPTNPMLPVAGFPYLPQPAYPPMPVPRPLPPIASPFASYMPPYGIRPRGASMVPGIPGLVSSDGGINILPFTDAYSNLLERHKQKMIRLRLQKLLDEYDNYPRRSSSEENRRIKMRRQNDEDMFDMNAMKQLTFNDVMDEDDRRQQNDDEMIMNKKDREGNDMMDIDNFFKKQDIFRDSRI